MTFTEWWQTTGVKGGRRVGHPSECKQAWNAALESAARIAEKTNVVFLPNSTEEDAGTTKANIIEAIRQEADRED